MSLIPRISFRTQATLLAVLLLVALNVLDAGITVWNLSTGRIFELNPLFSPSLFYLVWKCTLPLWILPAVWATKRFTPKEMLWIPFSFTVGLNVYYVAVVSWNILLRVVVTW
jgi:hypothetical protein